jgi:hypothetical protein
MAENGTESKFFELLAVEVACGASVAEAARRCECSDRQARRIVAEEAFKARVHELRAEIVRNTVGRLTAASERAAKRLDELLDSDRPVVAIQAAKAIQSALKPTSELGELRERLDALERSLRERVG